MTERIREMGAENAYVAAVAAAMDLCPVEVSCILADITIPKDQFEAARKDHELGTRYGWSWGAGTLSTAERVRILEAWRKTKRGALVRIADEMESAWGLDETARKDPLAASEAAESFAEACKRFNRRIINRVDPGANTGASEGDTDVTQNETPRRYQDDLPF